jgi:hypothetical protein
VTLLRDKEVKGFVEKSREMWVQEAREVKGPKGNVLAYLCLTDHLGRVYYAPRKGAASTLLRG